MRRKRFLLLTNLIHLPLTTYFADFTFTGTPEHHIKNVSKYTFGKLLKIVVLKHRVSYVHGNETWNKLLTFKPTYNENITEKISTRIIKLSNK